MQHWDEAERDKIRTSLANVLASSMFAGSPRQQRFLYYLVTNTLNGEADRLKGYTIAIDVFDRKDDFDPSLDAIVRVEATRLRNKLREYYDDVGRNDEFIIEFPKGGYAVQINYHKQTQSLNKPSVSISNGSSQVEDIPSLAVLPFTGVDVEAEHSYFIDGITDTLISELSRLSGLFIISRHSSFAYRNSNKSDKEIASELNVQFLLRGNLQKAGNRIRLSVQLVNENNHIPLWSERYDREIQDIFVLQDDLARNIAMALQIKLASAEVERFGHEGTKNMEAHDALLRGIEQHWQYTTKATITAQQFFRHAIELDENYAGAHAWLARSLMYEWIMRITDSTNTVFASAFVHAKRATEIDPLLAHGHAALGWVHYWHKEAEPALANVKKAVAMDPNNAETYLFLAQILASAGNGQEGLFYAETALRLNPRSSPWGHWVLGQCYWVLEDYDKALEAWEHSHKMSATFLPTQHYLCMLYAKLGNQKALQLQRDKTNVLLASGFVIRSPWLTDKLEAQHQALIQLAGLRRPD